MNTRKFAYCAVFTLVCVFGFTQAGQATTGDIFSKGMNYGATTYNNNPGNHPNIFCKPQTSGSNFNVCDINTTVNDGKGKGAELFAPEKGTVEVVTTEPSSWGNSIYWISEDRRERLHLAHLHSIVVREGKVEGNELIGYVGTTGKSTGVHLHISREYDGKAAPVILSGKTIEPKLNVIGLTKGYSSKGPITSSDTGSSLWNGQTKPLILRPEVHRRWGYTEYYMVMAWSPIPGADGYTVYQGDGYDGEISDDIVIYDKYWDVDDTSVTIRGLDIEFTCSFKVAAFWHENGKKVYGSKSDPLVAYWIGEGDGIFTEFYATFIFDP